RAALADDLAIELLLVDETQADGVRELELAAVLGHVGAQREDAARRVEAPDDRARSLRADQLDPDAEMIVQRSDEIVARRERGQPDLLAEGVGPLLEQREVVAVALEEVGDLVEGAVVEAELAALPRAVVALAPREIREQVVELAAGVLVQVEERGDRRGHLGLGAEARQVLPA